MAHTVLPIQWVEQEPSQKYFKLCPLEIPITCLRLILSKCHLMETWTLSSSFSGWGNKADDSKPFHSYSINPTRSQSSPNHIELSFVPLTVNHVKLNDRKVAFTKRDCPKQCLQRQTLGRACENSVAHTRDRGVLLWNVKKKEKTTLITVKKTLRRDPNQCDFQHCKLWNSQHQSYHSFL